MGRATAQWLACVEKRSDVKREDTSSLETEGSELRWAVTRIAVSLPRRWCRKMKEQILVSDIKHRKRINYIITLID